jgi:transposase InsO family protein
VELKRRNPRFGCPRIALIIARTFGITVDKHLVRRILIQHTFPESNGDGPSWLTFLGQMKDSLWSVDLFRCESITLRSHWVLVVMDQFTRRLIGFGVQADVVDGRGLCRMFNTIIAGKEPPRCVSSDHDPLFTYRRWQANLRILEVREIKSIPTVPLSHPFVERLIGTIRREFLDHLLFWNDRDLERKLEEFQHYYNHHRVHASMGGKTPAEDRDASTVKEAELDDFTWEKHCHGLVQLPRAA